MEAIVKLIWESFEKFYEVFERDFDEFRVRRGAFP